MKTTVAVFCKAPTPGKVKTRLAASIGDEKAVDVYKVLAEAVVASIPQDMVVAYVDDASGKDAVAEWLRCKVEVQTNGDLAARMIDCFEREFGGASGDASDAGPDVVMIVGSDVIFFETADIFSAIDTLTTKPLAIFPSEDGGFSLIAVRSEVIKNKVLGEIFNDVVWSTSGVMQKIAENCIKLGLEIGIGRVLNDVDTLQDLQLAIKKTSDVHQETIRRLSKFVRLS